MKVAGLFQAQKAANQSGRPSVLLLELLEPVENPL